MDRPSQTSEEAILDRLTLQLMDVLRRAWMWILGVVVIGVAGGYALSLTREPLYKATAVAVVAESSGPGAGGMLAQFQGLAALAGIGLGGGGENAEFMATLRSRQFADHFIRVTALAERICQLHCPDSLNTPVDEERLRLQAVSAFGKHVFGVDEDKLAGVIRVSITWPDRREAADLANRMFSEVNEMLRARARSEAEANLQYLTTELDRTVQVDMRQALYRLLERQSGRIMAANVTTDYAFRAIDPALPPDPEEPESPRRMIWAAVSGFLGGVIGLLGAWVAGRRRR